MDGRPRIEIERPRTIFQLLETAIKIYQQYPWLFLTLAAAVVVPYDLIVLAITGIGPERRAHESFGVGLLLNSLYLFLVSPLISALHVHGVLDVRDGKRPELSAVGRRALPALPVVSAAVIVSWFGIFAGFIALIVPGVLLSLRWSVVAQVAATEEGGWSDALRRSRLLTKTHYLHILGLLVLAEIIVGVPNFWFNRIVGNSDATVVSFVVGTALNVVFVSFTALTTALLYFDLSARWAAEPIDPVLVPSKDGFDPDRHADEDRPPGWYIDPDRPKQMRYWAAGGEPGWSERTVRTPKNIRTEWLARRDGGRTPEPTAAAASGVEPTGHPLDPDSYSDEDRPAGWYVEPAQPWRMRYWDPEDGWGKRTTKTPGKTQEGWYKDEGR